MIAEPEGKASNFDFQVMLVSCANKTKFMRQSVSS